MKQTLCSAFLLFCIVLPLTLQAGEKRHIVLIDNSVIVGEVVSMTGGIYTIRTETLGVIKIADSRVKSIGDTPGTAVVSGQQEITNITQRMLSDGSVMQQIQALQNDPEFQDILKDESIMRAIHSGDFNALLSNPKIIQLMENATVQQINKKMQ